MQAQAARKDDAHYTYADYAQWGDEVRYELIDGVAYMLAAPSMAHQEVSAALSALLWNFLKDKPCKVFTAPFDVRLNAAGRDDTVVQPDIAVICDRSKLDDKGCHGAPDLIAEILSPSSSGCDKLLKFNRYLQAGVREYWIVDPNDKTVVAYVLKNGEYTARAYGASDTAPVHVLEGCEIHLRDVFGEEAEAET